MIRLVGLETVDDDIIVDSGEPLARAAEVEVVGLYRLRVRFDDEHLAEADLEGLVHRSNHFAPLRGTAAFGRVEPVHDGAALRFVGDNALKIGIDLIGALVGQQRPMAANNHAAWTRRPGSSRWASNDGRL